MPRRVLGAAAGLLVSGLLIGAFSSSASGATINSRDFYAADGRIGCTTVGGASPVRVVCSARSLTVELGGRDARGFLRTGPGCRTPRSGGGYTAWCASGQLPNPNTLFEPVFMRPGDVWRYVTGTGRVRFTCRTTKIALTCRNEVGRGFTARPTPRAVKTF